MTIATEILDNLTCPLCVVSLPENIIKYANPKLLDYSNVLDKPIGEVLQNLESDKDFGCCFPSLSYVEFYDVPDEVYQVHQSKLDNGDIILLFIKTNINKCTAKNPFLRQHDVVVDFVQNAPLPLHSITDEGIYLWANKREHELLGFEEDEDMTGISIREFNCKKVDDRTLQEGFKNLKKGHVLREVKYSFETRHNTVKTMAVTANCKQLENGHFYSRTILRDETERSMRNAITYYYQRSQDAQRTARSKDMLLRQIFHDIKTPLQVLSSVIITQNMFTGITEYNYFEYAKNRLIGILMDVTILIGDYRYIKNTYDPSTRMLLHDYIIKVKNVVDNELRSGQIVHFHTHIHHPHILQYIHYHPLTCRSLFHIMRNAYIYSPDHAEVHIDVDLISKRQYCHIYDMYSSNTPSPSKDASYMHSCSHSPRSLLQEVICTSFGISTTSSNCYQEDGNDDHTNKKNIQNIQEDVDLDDLRCVFRISNKYDTCPMNLSNIKRRFMDIHELLYQDSVPIIDIKVEDTLNVNRGTGLGLSVVYQITKHMNGYLDCYVENNMNHFVFILPLITLVDEHTYKEIQRSFPPPTTQSTYGSHDSEEQYSLPKNTSFQDKLQFYNSGSSSEDYLEIVSSSTDISDVNLHHLDIHVDISDSERRVQFTSREDTKVHSREVCTPLRKTKTMLTSKRSQSKELKNKPVTHSYITTNQQDVVKSFYANDELFDASINAENPHIDNIHLTDSNMDIMSNPLDTHVTLSEKCHSQVHENQMMSTMTTSTATTTATTNVSAATSTTNYFQNDTSNNNSNNSNSTHSSPLNIHIHTNTRSNPLTVITSESNLQENETFHDNRRSLLNTLPTVVPKVFSVNFSSDLPLSHPSISIDNTSEMPSISHTTTTTTATTTTMTTTATESYSHSNIDTNNDEEYNNHNNKMTIRKLHILVVEDSIIIQKLMTRHILLRGHYCHCVNNGQEAVDYVNSCATSPSNHCDAILMDLRMPVMDGLTALQLIRKTCSNRQLPVYIVSAETTKTIQEKASVYGANGFFGKPVNMNSIIDMLEASRHHTNSVGHHHTMKASSVYS